MTRRLPVPDRLVKYLGLLLLILFIVTIPYVWIILTAFKRQVDAAAVPPKIFSPSSLKNFEKLFAGGKLTFARVLRGSFADNAIVKSARGEDRISGLSRLMGLTGSKQAKVEEGDCLAFGRLGLVEQFSKVEAVGLPVVDGAGAVQPVGLADQPLERPPLERCRCRPGCSGCRE